MCHRCHFRYDDVNGDLRGQPSPLRGTPRPENYGRSWNGKLDEAKVREIRRLLAEGELSVRAIGIKFDVSHGQITKIRDGKNWYWLDD